MERKHRMPKLRLTLDVEYKLNGDSLDNLTEQLEGIAKDAVERGMISGEGPATVEDYNYKVERL
jgi:hypothetical protein